MEAARKWLPYILVLILIAIIVGLLLFGDTKTVEKEIYIKGEIEKVIPGKPDTVLVPVPYPVYTERPKGDHHGKDSSTYAIANDHGKVSVTTFPATDSIRLDIEPVVIERFITRIDTALRVDTMKTFSTIIEESPWYDTFLSGFITAILAVTGVIGAFAL